MINISLVEIIDRYRHVMTCLILLRSCQKGWNKGTSSKLHGTSRIFSVSPMLDIAKVVDSMLRTLPPEPETHMEPTPGWDSHGFAFQFRVNFANRFGSFGWDLNGSIQRRLSIGGYITRLCALEQMQGSRSSFTHTCLKCNAMNLNMVILKQSCNTEYM